MRSDDARHAGRGAGDDGDGAGGGDGVSGYVDTDVRRLIPKMHELLLEPGIAGQLGDGARRYAMERFGIERFARDWDRAFREVTGPRRFASAGVETGLFK